MKKQTLQIILSLIISLICINLQGQPMSGTYTIGGTSPDFANLSTAIDSLVSKGINGPTTLLLRDGIYDEQDTIPLITGASEINNITIGSESQDSSKVSVVNNIFSSPTDNSVLTLDGTSFIEIRDITIENKDTLNGNGICITNESANIMINSCHIKMPALNDGSSVANVVGIVCNPTLTGTIDSIYITNNRFTHGGFGIQLPDPPMQSTLYNNINIANNNFKDQIGPAIYIEQTSLLIVEQNIISDSTSTSFPTANASIIIDMSEIQRIHSNQIYDMNSSGLIILFCSDFGTNSYIANNMISCESNNEVFALKTEACNGLRFFHNSLYAKSPNENSAAMYHFNDYSELKNNIFVGSQMAYSFIFYELSKNSKISSFFSDNNNYYQENDTNLFQYSPSSSSFYDLASWQSFFKADTNSMVENPQFFATNDLRINNKNLAQTGTNTIITTDIFGTPRPYTPTPGAYEFPKLSGIFTIGGTSPDYTSINEAINDLNTFGVGGNIEYHLRNGIYNEEISLAIIAGMSDTTKITFKSESGDSTQVIIEYLLNSPGENSIINICCMANNISFENLTIRPANGSSHSRLVNISEGARNIQFKGCVFEGLDSGTGEGYELLYFDYTGSADFVEHIDISHNEFVKGNQGIYLDPVGGMPLKHVNIKDNNFKDQSKAAIDFITADSIFIENNVIYTDTAGFSAMILDSVDNIKIKKNQILLNNGGKGIIINESYNSEIYNNMIRINGSGSLPEIRGMLINESEMQSIYYNTILIDYLHGTVDSTAAVEISDLSNTINLGNNILINNQNGYAIKVKPDQIALNTDYNNLYSLNGNLGYHNGVNLSDLAQWQTEFGGMNSLSILPVFAPDNLTNLHLSKVNLALSNMGMNVPSITEDIDQQLRRSTQTDIGADEYVALFLGEDTTICQSQGITLDAGNPGSNYLWSTGATTQTITINTADTYFVEVTETTGIVSADTIIISTFPNTIVEAGDDQAICPDITEVGLNGTVSGNTNSGIWTSSGAGTFDNDTVLTTNYHLSIDDIQAGGVTLYLNSTNDICNSIMDSTIITIKPALVVDFLINDSTSVNKKTVVFYNEDTTEIASYNWNFDGGLIISGNINSAGPFLISWETPGIKNVCIDVTDTGGCISDTQCKAIMVIEEQGICLADFTASTSTTNTSVTFTNNSAGGTNAVYHWQFGDGNTSTDENPVHVYDEPGFYTVCLTIYDSTINCQDEYCAVIEAGNTTAICNADFNYVYDSLNNAYQFFDYSTGNITSWYWEFGDGNISTSQNPSHQYSTPGVYEVVLCAHDDNNNCIAYFDDIIIHGDQTQSIDANFIYYNNGISQVTKFFNQSTAPQGSFTLWNFGDDSISTEVNPVHTYSNPGFYDVCMTVWDPFSQNSDMKCKVVKAGNDTSSIYNSFFYVIDSVRSQAGSYPVSYKGAAFGDPAQSIWNFGDGEMDTTTTVQTNHTYTDTGFYFVSHKVINAQGLSSTSYKLVNVFSAQNYVKGMFDFIKKNPVKANGQPVSFKGAAFGDPAQAVWTFGNGHKDSTTLLPTYTYKNNGIYEVCLTVKKPTLNQSNTFCKNIEISGIGINELLNTHELVISVNPNPANQYINLGYYLPADANFTWKIYNISGELVGNGEIQKQTKGSHNKVIDLHDFDSGMYFIHINAANQSGVEKFIIMK